MTDAGGGFRLLLGVDSACCWRWIPPTARGIPAVVRLLSEVGYACIGGGFSLLQRRNLAVLIKIFRLIFRLVSVSDNPAARGGFRLLLEADSTCCWRRIPPAVGGGFRLLLEVDSA